MEKKVLCASSAYEQKYYLAKEFEALPQAIKDELKIMCVLYTEDIGGIISLVFDEDGSLMFEVSSKEEDLLFDDIGSVLKVKQLKQEKQDLLEALEMYYRVVFLKEEV